MKRFLLSITGITALALLLGTGAMAQDKEKTKSKLGDNDVITIRKNGDKDAKVTIEIKDGNVTINGKPLDEYDNDDLVIRKSKRGNVIMATPGSPFRSGNWSFNNNNDFFGNANENKAFLGVVTEDAEGGVKVEDVTEGSAAEKAGLKEGDVISMIGDKKIEDPDDLTKAIGKYKPEDKVTVTYKRDGKENKMSVTLGKRKNNLNFNYNVAPQMTTPRFDFGEGGQLYSWNGGRPRLGIRAQDTEDDKGAKVLSVTDESAADKAGIKEGDIITEFDGKTVKNADELAGAAQDSKEKSAVKVTFNRDGKSQTVEVKTPKKLKTENL